MKDYYKTLGIEKNASKDDVKKAFRKLAHEHHPDKTKGDPTSATKFKEASEAYSVLSDDNKRAQYDRFGSAGPGMDGAGGAYGGAGGFGGQSGFGGFNAQDFNGFDFSQFTQGAGSQGGVEFDLGDIFGDFFGGGRGRGGGRGQARQERGRDVSVDIQISLEEAVFGVEREIHVTKSSLCNTCEGTGAKPGTNMKTCVTCAGQGKVNETRRSFMGVFTTTRICDECHGKGQIPVEKCPTCRGEGVMDRQQEIIAKIPAGIEDDQMVRLNKMGEAIVGGMPGDMYIKVHVKPHAFIRRDGLNLLTDLRIKLTTAITGGEQTIKTLDGDLVLKIPEGSNNGDVLRIKNNGVPNDHGRRGDFLVKLIVEMPRKLSRTAREAIEKLKGEGV